MCDFSKNMDNAIKGKKIALASMRRTDEQMCDPAYHSVDIDKLIDAQNGLKVVTTGTPDAVVISEKCQQLLNEIISEGSIYDLQDIIETAIRFTHQMCSTREQNRFFFNGMLYTITHLNKKKGETK